MAFYFCLFFSVSSIDKLHHWPLGGTQQSIPSLHSEGSNYKHHWMSLAELFILTTEVHRTCAGQAAKASINVPGSCPPPAAVWELWTGASLDFSSDKPPVCWKLFLRAPQRGAELHWPTLMTGFLTHRVLISFPSWPHFLTPLLIMFSGIIP